MPRRPASEPPGQGRRTPGRLAAICASIAVHVLAAWGMASLRPPAAPAPQRAMSVQIVSTPPSRQLAPPRPVQHPETSGSDRAVAESSRPPVAQRSVGKRLDAQDAAAVQVAPQAAAVIQPAPSLPSAPPQEAPFEVYRRRLWAHLAAHAPAAAAGSGTAVVKFGLSANGELRFVALERSSGRPAFDRACLAAVRAAAPLPSPPPGSTLDELVFTVPIKARALTATSGGVALRADGR